MTFNKAEPPSLSHLKRMTTPDGLMQHSIRHLPDPRYGYSIDDNARALIAVYKYGRVFGKDDVAGLANIYIDYIKRALTSTGRFHNFANYQAAFIDKSGSPDSFGRTIWAIGFAVNQGDFDPEVYEKALKLSRKYKFDLKKINYIRSWGFALIGYYYLKDRRMVKRIADHLVKIFKKNSDEDWQWFENQLTYSNAILPYGLFLAYDLIRDQRYLEVAEESLSFLYRVCQIDGKPAPIGQNGWYAKDQEKAKYDQQAVDATDMVLAAAEGFRLTKKMKYKRWAEIWWSWFEGNNIGRRCLIDKKTGGCLDGLTPSGTNPNQGAESVVCYLLAYMAMTELANVSRKRAIKETRIKEKA